MGQNEAHTDDDGGVDREQRDFQVCDSAGQFVDLERQVNSAAHSREPFRPAALAPESVGFHEADQGIRGGAHCDPPETGTGGFADELQEDVGVTSAGIQMKPGHHAFREVLDIVVHERKETETGQKDQGSFGRFEGGYQFYPFGELHWAVAIPDEGDACGWISSPCSVGGKVKKGRRGGLEAGSAMFLDRFGFGASVNFGVLSNVIWRVDAVVRLIAGVFLCMYAGSVVGAWLLGHLKPGAAPWMLYCGLGIALLCLGAALVLVNRPLPETGLKRRLAAVLGCFYGGLFGGAWVQTLLVSGGASVWQMVVASLSFQGAALPLMWHFLREHETGFVEAFGMDRAVGFALATGGVAALVFLPMGWGLQELSGFIMTNLPFFRLEPQEQQAVQTLRTAATYADRVALGLVTIAIAPPAEELLFRGVLYRWIKGLGFPRGAVWGTSALFAAVHMNMVTFLPLMALALVMVWLYERTGNLLAPIAAHTVFNALNFALFYFAS